MSARDVLVVRLDSDGDVLLTGPAIRAVAAGADRVTLLCGPRGRQAGELLPGVDRVVEYRAEWIDPSPPAVDRSRTLALVDRLAGLAVEQAFVFTSFHQSPLPTALLLRLAGVPVIAAVCDDYPGSLLDVRHRVGEDVHEVERALSLVATLGYRLPPGDSGLLAVIRPAAAEPAARWVTRRYVAVHPGTSVPARAWAPERYAVLVDALLAAGWRVAITGSPGEASLTAYVAGTRRPGVVDLGGRTSLAQLAEVLAGADAVVVGNTGPAHLSAAVGTPVVSLFAPTVPPSRWRPWGVPHALLGAHDIACAGCRATSCPIPGHPCLDRIEAAEILGALRALLADRDRTYPPTVTVNR